VGGNRGFGITDEMVVGHRIDERAVNDLLGRVVLVIAHNADFDRRFGLKVMAGALIQLPR
jgi:hypothetical protein